MATPDPTSSDAPLWAALFAGAIGVALLILVAAILSRGARSAILRGWMVALIAAIAAGIWESWLLESGFYRTAPHLLGLFNGAFLLVGPCLWGYASALVGKSLSARSAVAHIAPFLIYTIWLCFVFLFEDAAHKIRVAEISLSMGYQMSPIAWAKLLHLAAYGWFTLRLIRKTRHGDESYFSSLGERDLSWLTRLVGALLGAIMLLLLAQPLAAAGYLDVRTMNNIATVALAVLIFIIAAQSLSQPGLEPVTDCGEDAPSYARSGIDADLLHRFVRQIEETLDQDRLYTDPSLNLAKLARLARLTPQQASQAINQGLGTSFYDLVNDRRVAEAQRLLLAHDSSILEAAIDAGFANKATFNKAFKARCGMTPSAWRAAERADS